MGIAARIASLKLNQVGRHPLGKPPVPPPPARRVREPEESEDEGFQSSSSLPPPPPPRRNAPPPLPARKTRTVSDTSPELIRALSRPPPPPPTPKRTESSPALPPRRVPPLPARLPTPEPEPEPEPEEYEYEYEPESDDGYQSQLSSEDSCLKCRDFSDVDAHAALFPRQTVSSLDHLAHDLTSPFETETEKVRAIFTWLHHNIAYDCESFFSGNLRAATGESTLKSGLAVCDGYAGLFKALGDCVGLQVHKVTGHGKGFGYAPLGPDEPVPEESSNHAWNCVMMDGEWHLIDSCWGAGALQNQAYTKRFAPVWFTYNSIEFGKRHFPTDPSYQLITEEDGGPVSWEDYILAPEGPVVFGDFEKLDFSPDLLQPATKYVQSGTWVSFHIWKQCEHMSRDEADNYAYFINTQDDTKTPMELNAEGGWSANIYIPRGQGDISLYYVTQVNGQDAKGLGAQGFKNATGRKAMAFGGMARWTAI